MSYALQRANASIVKRPYHTTALFEPGIAQACVLMHAGGGWPILSESRLTRLPHPSRAFCGRVGSGEEHDTHLFSPARGPLRFDLDNPFPPSRIVNKTTPFPVL